MGFPQIITKRSSIMFGYVATVDPPECPMTDNISPADVPIIGCHSIAGVDTEVDDRRDTRTHQRGHC